MSSDSECPVCLLALQGDSGLLALATKPTKLRESLRDSHNNIKCNLYSLLLFFPMLELQLRRDTSQMDLDLRLPRSGIRNAYCIRVYMDTSNFLIYHSPADRITTTTTYKSTMGLLVLIFLTDWSSVVCPSEPVLTLVSCSQHAHTRATLYYMFSSEMPPVTMQDRRLLLEFHLTV
jgi:hypothetical protein